MSADRPAFSGQQPDHSPRHRRDAGHDALKGALVIAINFVHTLELLGQRAQSLIVPVHFIVSAWAFSTFMLANGTRLSFEGTTSRRWSRSLVAAAQLWGIALVIGLDYLLLVERLPLTTSLGRLLTFAVLPPYAQFLLTFALLALLVPPLRGVLAWASASWTRIVLVCLALLLSTLLPGLLGGGGTPALLLIGLPTGEGGYPLLPYLPLFVLGVALRRQRPAPERLMPAALSLTLVAFLLSDWLNYDQGWHFPPSAPFVLTSIPPAMLCWALARRWGERAPLLLRRLGASSLRALLVVTLALITIRGAYGDKPLLPLGSILLITLGLNLLAATLSVSLREPGSSERPQLADASARAEAQYPAG